MIASPKEYAVVGYDLQRVVYELHRSSVGFDEEIRFVSFLDDNLPSFIFMIIFSAMEQKTIFKILKLSKNKEYELDFHVQDSKTKIKKQIIDNYKLGNFQERRKKSYDNIELVNG